MLPLVISCILVSSLTFLKHHLSLQNGKKSFFFSFSALNQDLYWIFPLFHFYSVLLFAFSNSILIQCHGLVEIFFLHKFRWNILIGCLLEDACETENKINFQDEKNNWFLEILWPSSKVYFIWSNSRKVENQMRLNVLVDIIYL